MVTVADLSRWFVTPVCMQEFKKALVTLNQSHPPTHPPSMLLFLSICYANLSGHPIYVPCPLLVRLCQRYNGFFFSEERVPLL